MIKTEAIQGAKHWAGRSRPGAKCKCCNDTGLVADIGEPIRGYPRGATKMRLCEVAYIPCNWCAKQRGTIAQCQN